MDACCASLSQLEAACGGLDSLAQWPLMPLQHGRLLPVGLRFCILTPPIAPQHGSEVLTAEVLYVAQSAAGSLLVAQTLERECHAAFCAIWCIVKPLAGQS